MDGITLSDGTFFDTGGYNGYSNSGGSWETWVQDIGKIALSTYVETQYKAPLEIEKMRLQAFGPFGQPYIEGVPALGGTMPIPTAWILLGGAVLVGALLMMD
jgi:hypothetical protein